MGRKSNAVREVRRVRASLGGSNGGRKTPVSPPRRPRFSSDSSAVQEEIRFAKFLGLRVLKSQDGKIAVVPRGLQQWERMVLKNIQKAPTREAGDEIFSANATRASERARVRWLRALQELKSAFDPLGNA